jgi:hypothetical protein
MRNDFSKFSKDIKVTLPIKPEVLETGSNDGVLISPILPGKAKVGNQ